MDTGAVRPGARERRPPHRHRRLTRRAARTTTAPDDSVGGLEVTSGGQVLQSLAGGGVLAQRHQVSGPAEAVGRHVAVDRLVLTGADQERLVPDARAVGLAQPLPVGAPGREVRIALVLGEALEVLE